MLICGERGVMLEGGILYQVSFTAGSNWKGPGDTRNEVGKQLIVSIYYVYACIMID